MLGDPPPHNRTSELIASRSLTKRLIRDSHTGRLSEVIITDGRGLHGDGVAFPCSVHESYKNEISRDEV